MVPCGHVGCDLDSSGVLAEEEEEVEAEVFDITPLFSQAVETWFTSSETNAKCTCGRVYVCILLRVDNSLARCL